jgi:hypothetical protein
MVAVHADVSRLYGRGASTGTGEAPFPRIMGATTDLVHDLDRTYILPASTRCRGGNLGQ